MTYRVGERIVAALWVGSLWAIGYLVAPLLFARLDDRGLAGFLAGEFFTVITWMSLVCGGLLVAVNAPTLYDARAEPRCPRSWRCCCRPRSGSCGR